ncbi:hypothetical protein [Psychroserpens sp. NJDZ02]|uniref:hypothetical protein n=1 Tax=Psychroserpens sp. NJDZ02 TaxID=2570561 RepID=UPI0010A8D818|nr:hypothetical protein [Psychroserpens sp. NJDZ02]QCE41372.1 hypothetical protein E9099_08080 [Psychroserpens sp. NJDZ02]
MTQNELNIIGLAFDIIGVVLLFFYEPPKPEIGAILLESAPSKSDRDKIKKVKKMVSKIALILILIGFSIQIYSNTIQ